MQVDLFAHRSRFYVLGGVLLLGVMAFSFYCQGGGFLDVESQAFLLHYTSARGVLERVFDVARTDWNCYQAREFSYLVDLLDAKFIEASVAAGVIHFLSLSHYLLMLLIAGAHFWFMHKYFPKVPRALSLLLLLVYVTTPSSLIASFFRSSKILVGFFLFVLLWVTTLGSRGLNGRSLKQDRSWLAYLGLVFGLALLMTLSDRQGFFFSCALGVVFTAAGVLGKSVRWLTLAGVFFSASVVNTVYNLYVGPALIHELNGYYPDFSFQNMRFLYVLEGVSLHTLAGRVAKSFYLLGETLSYYFGSLGGVWGLVLIAGFVVLQFRWQRKARDTRAWLVLLSLALLYAMALILIFRAPYLLWVEHKLVYYWIPTNSIILFASSLFVVDLLQREKTRKSVVVYFLSATVFLNLSHLPSHYKAYTSAESHFARPSLAASELRECIAQTKMPLEAFSLSTRERDVCGKLRG